jgi:hypothetical protein
MDYIFFQMTAVNGFDGVSHYLRASLLTNLCSTYATAPAIGCNANFTPTQAIGAAGNPDQTLARTRAALRDPQLAPEPKPEAKPKPGTPTKTNPFDALRELTDPAIAHQRREGLRNSTGAGRNASPAFGQETPQSQALDYLLGNDDR